jgi:F0F1-type ATP synthase delta subunit
VAKLNKHLRKLVTKMVKSSVNKDGKINSLMVNRFTRILKGLSLSQSILALTDFSKGIKREINKTSLTVESFAPLSPASKKQLEKQIKNDYLVTKSTYVLNSSLLGGLRVKIGDTLIDDSLQARAKQLKERIIHG